MKKRFLSLLCIVLALSLGFGAVSAQDTTRYTGGWPYQVPPDGHFNMYASGRIDLGIYIDLMLPPLAVYIWSTGEYEPMIAESFGFDDDNNYVVTLKQGVTWSDGSPVTSEDLVVTFNTFYLIGAGIWNAMDSVEALDEYTVRFNLNAPSLDAERRILTENLRPASVYGEFAERAVPLIEARVRGGDADFDAALADLTAFRPEMHVSAGPYVLLAENITDANVLLVRNEGGFNSDVVRFDEVLLWNGETEAVTPLVSSGELAYGTYGFPPATEAAFIEAGIDIIRGAAYTGPALYFNHSVSPFDQVEVRQAIAYAINREVNGFVSLGASGIASECMCGISDNLVPLWLSDEAQAALNFYDYDLATAEALLEGVGFTRGGDGVWQDADGNRMAFELIFPAEFLDWAAAAENVTQQLNDFGFDITARGVQFQQQQQDVYDSNFQLAIRNWGIGSPFPGTAFLQPYERYNGQGELAGEGVGGGMRFNPNITWSGGELNVYEASYASLQGLDTSVQAEIVEALALSFNELLPLVPLWERYGNNPFNRSVLDGPAATDPIYNNAGADHFITYLILTGGLGPAN